MMKRSPHQSQTLRPEKGVYCLAWRRSDNIGSMFLATDWRRVPTGPAGAGFYGYQQNPPTLVDRGGAP